MVDHGLAALYHRALNSADRCFYRTLKTLQETKKVRGFVPKTQVVRSLVAAAPAFVPSGRKAASGFVLENATEAQPSLLEIFTRAKAELGLTPSQLVDLLKSAA
jgi:hypothetical protein